MNKPTRFRSLWTRPRYQLSHAGNDTIAADKKEHAKPDEKEGDHNWVHPKPTDDALQGG
jgi:hypothetical protein